jgi:hypothetical protein
MLPVAVIATTNASTALTICFLIDQAPEGRRVPQRSDSGLPSRIVGDARRLVVNSRRAPFATGANRDRRTLNCWQQPSTAIPYALTDDGRTLYDEHEGAAQAAARSAALPRDGKDGMMRPWIEILSDATTESSGSRLIPKQPTRGGTPTGEDSQRLLTDQL